MIHQTPFFRTILPYASGLLFLLLAGCAKEELRLSAPVDPDGGEGEPTTLLIGFNDVDMTVHTRAALPEYKEREINSLAVYIFDSVTGLSVSSIFHATAGTHAVDASGNPIEESPGNPVKTIYPDGTTYIPIETLTGNNRKIYVIANYDANVIEDLKLISSEEQLKEAIFEQVSNPLFREFGMTKVGDTIANVRKNTPIKVTLNFVSAKITIKVANFNTAHFKVEGWTMGNIPKKGYVIPRDPIATDPNYHDASDITSDNDYYNDFSDQRFDFEDTVEVTSPSVVKTYSSTFYMIENRRGERIDRVSPPPPPVGETRQEYQLKAWYAPPRASYARIYGTLTEDGEKRQVVITHYLGEDNSKDYNIKRGKHYTYTISVKALNQIHIDTNVEIDNARLRVTPPADPMTLDAHFGFRVIQIHTHEIENTEYSVDVEVLQAVNSTVHPDWIDLAVTPITTHQVKKTGDASISLWQQDGGVENTYVRSKFIPKKAVRDTLTGYRAPDGIVIGADTLYPDNDTELSFDMATHRMCKKITNLPTKAKLSVDRPINIMLYTDEYPYNPSPTAPAYREAVVRVTLKRNGTDLEYNHFTVRQYPHIRYMQLPGQPTLLVERVEEYDHLLQPGLALDRQMLAGIQWGPFNVPDANNRLNGADNTLYGVYQAGPNVPVRNADTYTPMYGSEGGSWSYDNHAKIEPYTGVTQGGPDFNFPSVTSDNYVNTIYNVTAARYCHEKNWDTNGNGNIDPQETVWYLPSTLEMQQFWILRELLSLSPDYYWSSVQFDSDKAYAFSMMASSADAHRVYDGIPQPLPKSGVHDLNRPRARCVRGAAAGVTGIAPIVRQLPNKNLAIDCSNLPGAVYTLESKMNIVQGNNIAIQRSNHLLYKKLEVDGAQPPAVNYYALHSGNGLCNQAQGWRLPTQREMLLIWAMKDKLEGAGSPVFQRFEAEKYWTMTRGLRVRYLVDFSTGLSEYEEFTDSDASITRRYRCVREIP